jgi:hypothetical protein
VADRAQRGASDLAHTLGDEVGHRESLFRLLVEQEVIVAKGWPGFRGEVVCRSRRAYGGSNVTGLQWSQLDLARRLA